MSVISKTKRKMYLFAASYFRFFANKSLKRWNPKIFAVTGSAGKTTMLHLLEYELSGEAHYSHDANSAFGIAFDILGMKGIKGSRAKWFYLFFAAPFRAIFYTHKEKYYVVEIDGERPHEAEFVAKWLKPDVTFWISMGLSHAAKFDGVVKSGKFASLEEAIANEFAELPRNTKKRVYVDAGSKVMMRETKDVKAKVVAISDKEMKKYTVAPFETEFVDKEKTVYHFASPQPPELSLQLLMLRDFCKYLKKTFKSDFSDISLPPSRSSTFKGINGLTLIDSSYNAHIISVQTIFDMAKEMRLKHLWLVMGDIIEQGSIEQSEHEKLAEMIAELKPEKVILVGHRTKKYTAPRLLEYGIDTVTTVDPRKALNYIKREAKHKEVILFKGSQYLEWLVEKLLLDKTESNKLCRRDKASIRRREKRGLV